MSQYELDIGRQVVPYGGGGVLGGYNVPSGMVGPQQAPWQSGQGGGGNGGMSLQSLLGMQQSDNQWARNAQQGDWNNLKGQISAGQQGDLSNPYLQQAGGLISNLMSNPEAMNDQTFGMMQNQAQNQINSQYNQMGMSQANQAYANGQMGGSADQAANQRLGMARAGALMGNNSNMMIQRAQQRNQDIMNAAKMGQGLAGQMSGINQNYTRMLGEFQPQYKADDYSGFAALLGQGQGGMGGGGFGGGAGGSTAASSKARHGMVANSFNSQFSAPQGGGPGFNDFGIGPGVEEGNPGTPGFRQNSTGTWGGGGNGQWAPGGGSINGRPVWGTGQTNFNPSVGGDIVANPNYR